MIPRIEAAVQAYPFADRYRSYPGPNSNTFTAHVARSVPELGLDLPPTAIGKDYRPLADAVGRAPGGGGVLVLVRNPSSRQFRPALCVCARA